MNIMFEWRYMWPVVAYSTKNMNITDEYIEYGCC